MRFGFKGDNRKPTVVLQKELDTSPKGAVPMPDEHARFLKDRHELVCCMQPRDQHLGHVFPNIWALARNRQELAFGHGRQEAGLARPDSDGISQAWIEDRELSQGLSRPYFPYAFVSDKQIER